jgi:hypothetical protein
MRDKTMITGGTGREFAMALELEAEFPLGNTKGLIQ